MEGEDGLVNRHPARAACRRKEVRAVDIHSALTVFNNPSLRAYLDYTHSRLYREVGEFEFGYDDQYDEIASALAFVSVEMALDEDLCEFIPAKDPLSAESARADEA
jgi:hypothetical protein